MTNEFKGNAEDLNTGDSVQVDVNPSLTKTELDAFASLLEVEIPGTWARSERNALIAAYITAARRLFAEVESRGRAIEALSARLTAKNTELDKTIQGMLNAGAEWAEKIGTMRAERDEALREAAADKAKLAAVRVEPPELAAIRERVDRDFVTDPGSVSGELAAELMQARIDRRALLVNFDAELAEHAKPAPEMPRPPAEEGAMAPDEETEDAIRGQHQTTVRGGNWVSLRCDCREWELEVPAGLDAMPRLKAAHAEHVAEMVAEGARLAAQEPVSGPETAGTGSGRGTGVAEASGAAQECETATAWIDKRFPDIDGDDFHDELTSFEADKAEYCRAVDTKGCCCKPHPDLPGCGLLNRWCREHGLLAHVPAELTQSISGIRGGEPCILNTRVPVEEVAGYLADGATWDEIREMLPSLPSLPVPSTEKGPSDDA